MGWLEDNLGLDPEEDLTETILLALVFVLVLCLVLILCCKARKACDEWRRRRWREREKVEEASSFFSFQEALREQCAAEKRGMFGGSDSTALFWTGRCGGGGGGGLCWRGGVGAGKGMGWGRLIDKGTGKAEETCREE